VVFWHKFLSGFDQGGNIQTVCGVYNQIETFLTSKDMYLDEYLTKLGTYNQIETFLTSKDMYLDDYLTELEVFDGQAQTGLNGSCSMKPLLSVSSHITCNGAFPIITLLEIVDASHMARSNHHFMPSNDWYESMK